jgi:hypothetical protein
MTPRDPLDNPSRIATFLQRAISLGTSALTDDAADELLTTLACTVGGTGVIRKGPGDDVRLLVDTANRRCIEVSCTGNRVSSEIEA